MSTADRARPRSAVALAIGLAVGLVVVAPVEPAGATELQVTSGADAGPGTLRQAIAAANQVDDDVVIGFGVAEVGLTSGHLQYTGGIGGDHSLQLVGGSSGDGSTIHQGRDGHRILTSTTSGVVSLRRVTLMGGRSGGSCGGAVSATGPLELHRSMLASNTSTCGGGGAFAPDIALTDSVVVLNNGGVVGGGLAAPGGSVTLVRSVVLANSAQFGGGVHASHLVLDGSTLESNEASVLGGGAYVEDVRLLNSTVSGNDGGNAGGGIAGEAESEGGGAIELVYSTVTGNTATVSRNLSGGTLRSFASAVGGGCGFTDGTTSDGHNRSSDISCGFTDGAAGDAENVALLLGPLAANGGRTRTHAPQAGSPLLDAVPAGSCQAAGAAGVVADQRGQGRPAAAGCDIGAVEVRTVAQTKTWIGAAGGLWSAPGNWTPLGVPFDGDSLVFPAGSTSVHDLFEVQVASITGAAGVTVSGAPGAGGIELTGGLVGGLDLGVPLVLPAGSHALQGPAELAEVGGPGDVVISSGEVGFGSADGFDGDIDVVAGGSFVGDLGTAVGGLTIRAGASAEPHLDGDVAEPIQVQGASGVAELHPVSTPGARLTGPVVLGADLDVTEPVVLAGTISGPGGLLVAGGEVSGANTYAGGTDVRGTLRVATAGSLGSGAVVLTPTATLQLAPGVVLPNPVSSSSTAGARAFVVAEGAAELAGPVNVTGTGETRFHVAFGGELVSRSGFQSAAPVAVVAGSPAETALPHSASAVIEGPGAASGGLSVSGVDLYLEAVSVVGSLRVDQGSVTTDSGGSVFLPSTQIRVTDGWLWTGGAEATANDAVLQDGGELYLGRIDDQGTDVGRLSLGGPYTQLGDSYVEFVIAGTANDQVRASSVTLGTGARFGFYVEAASPPGHVHRLVDNTGTLPVDQRWQDAPEGSIWQAGNLLYRLSYRGGTGNDITLTRLPGLHSSWGFEQIRDHGGVMLTPPGLSSWGGDRLDVWAVGTDRALWHRWEQGGAAGWEPLGGTLLSAPAGVSQVPGQADVFARGGDDSLWVRRYRSGWGPWTRLGGTLTAAPSVTSWAPGRVDIAARGADGGVWHGSIVNGVFQGWTALGGFTTHAPVIVDWGPGQLHVFARGGNGALFVRSYGGGGWGPWISLGGFTTDGPAVAAPAAGEVAVFARGADGILWHRSYENAAWSDWRSLEVAIREGVGATGIQPGEIEVGWRSSSGSLWTTHGFQPSAVDAASAAGTPVPERRAGTTPGTRVDVPQAP